MNQKEQAREEVLTKRKKLTTKFAEIHKREIAENLRRLPTWRSSQIVHVYLSLEGRNEIDTWPIVKWLLENGHEVWSSHLPEDHVKDGFCQITINTKYGKDRFGAPLPIERVHKTINPSVIIVPCLAADNNGNRLGYGSGWYDRFLAKHPKALKIGLVYDQFLLDEIPHEPHDIQLDFIITESERVYVS